MKKEEEQDVGQLVTGHGGEAGIRTEKMIRGRKGGGRRRADVGGGAFSLHLHAVVTIIK